MAVPVRMMWLLVFAKVCCGCLPSGDCNFSCTQIGYNSGCLDARSLTLPWYCPGVGRSVRTGAYAPSAPPHIEMAGHQMPYVRY